MNTVEGVTITTIKNKNCEEKAVGYMKYLLSLWLIFVINRLRFTVKIENKNINLERNQF